MKPSIPEIGTILRMEGDTAVILLQGGEHCEGCGAGKLGLCKPSGNAGLLRAKNTIKASVGDKVKVGLAVDIQTSGYLLAFVVPVISLVAGTLAGHLAGQHFSIPYLEVITGFAALALTLCYTLRRLKRLDSSYTLTVNEVLSDDKLS